MPIDAEKLESSIDGDNRSCFDKWALVTTCHGASDIGRVLLECTASGCKHQITIDAHYGKVQVVRNGGTWVKG